MQITDFIAPENAIVCLRASDARGVIDELGRALAPFADLEAATLTALLHRREQVDTTAVGHEVAIPHARTPDVAATVGIVGLSVAGVDFRAADGRPVHVFVTLVSPVHGGKHLHAIACAARDLESADLRRRLLAAAAEGDVGHAYRILSAGRAIR